MTTAASPSTPTGILPRFGLFIQAMRRGLGESLDRRRMVNQLDPRLPPLADLLWHFLNHTMRRFTALCERFAAGKLPRAPRRAATPRPEAERPSGARRRTEPSPGRLPPGPVFLRFGLAPFEISLRELLDDPEMRALLAASPTAGRLLRPLWRRLTSEPLPEVLREPPRPPRPSRPGVRREGLRGTNPSSRPLVGSAPPKPARGEGEEAGFIWHHRAPLRPDAAPEPPPYPPPWVLKLFQR